MKKMNKLLLLSILAGLFSSCGSKSAENGQTENTIVVDESLLNIPHKASDVFSDITLVPLETSDSCLIADITKIVPVGDTLFIIDTKSKAVLLFDRNGRFLKKIRRVGRGPGEYLTLDDFTVTRSGRIIILDGEYNKLIFFDKDGAYISEQKLPIYVNALECINDTIVVCNGCSDEDRIILWDLQTEKVLASYIEYDFKYTGLIRKPLIKYGKSIYFQRSLSSVIYQPEREGLKQRWFIDFGKRNIVDDELLIAKDFHGIYYNPPHTADIHTFTETDKYVSFFFQCEELEDGEPYTVLYSKTTGKQLFLFDKHYTDDLTFQKYSPYIETATETGELLRSVVPMYFLEELASHKPENMQGRERERWKALQQQLKNVKPFDNPIIMFMTLKDF